MANTKSAEKRNRQAETRRARNRAVTSRLRTTIKKTRATLVETKGDDANSIVSTVHSEIDKAAKKGVLKKNTANRYKSRLAKAAKASV
jgi:small subunit ribosomal protein S20